MFVPKVRETNPDAESDEGKNVSELNTIDIDQLNILLFTCRVAMQIARTRELLNWFGSFYVLAAVGMIAGYRRSGKPGVLVPLLPLSFVFGYQIDMGYGNKIQRIKCKLEFTRKPSEIVSFLNFLYR